mmetsp:Transcript_30650/g.64245  ORF Transcript_30650/g.64245 Transcript_30650/m.64245 type:complete len:99 (+) Transcript_30650:172-468(+)
MFIPFPAFHITRFERMFPRSESIRVLGNEDEDDGDGDPSEKPVSFRNSNGSPSLWREHTIVSGAVLVIVPFEDLVVGVDCFVSGRAKTMTIRFSSFFF